MVSLERLDKHLRSLLKTLKIVVETKSKTEISLDGKPNPTLSCLNKYIRAYDVGCKDDPTGVKYFLDDFFRLYKQNRQVILNTDFKWLKTQSICIKFGEGIANSRRDIRIMLSDIYLSACELKSAAEKKLEGLPDKEWETCEELNYPDIILLHLYRIFKDLCPEDSESLGRLVGIMEDNLGIVNSNGQGMLTGLNGLINVVSTVASGQGGSTQPGQGGDLLNSFGDLGGLGKLIAPIMSSIGKAANGNGDASMSDIGGMLAKLDLNSLISNLTNTLSEPGTQNSLQSALSQLQNSPEIGNLMSNVGRMLEGNGGSGGGSGGGGGSGSGGGGSGGGSGSCDTGPSSSVNETSNSLMLGPPSLAIPVNTLHSTAMTAFSQCEKKMISSKEESYI